jgi:hypothetical protein
MFKWFFLPLLVLAALAAAYFWAALNWSYSSGERAGYVQKLSKKGWLCKTWEGELAMVSLPGTAQEKFAFTIVDDAVAETVTKAMGKRVALHYEEKVGLPTSCFGETRHYITKVVGNDEALPLPGAAAPAAPATPAAPAAVTTAPSVQPAPPVAAAAPASAASR